MPKGAFSMPNSYNENRKPTAIIVDVDGTACDVSAVRHFVLDDPGNKDFDKFHEAATGCPVNQDVLDAARKAKADGHAVIIVTARKEKWRYSTLWWLLLNDFPFDHQFHRRDKDGRPDYEVKKEILSHIRTRYEVIHAYDDNPSVIRLWEEEGIATTKIPGWLEDKESLR